MAQFETRFNADKLLARLKSMQEPERLSLGLRRAGIYLLSEAQHAIKESGPGWPGFKRPPKKPHQLLYLTGRLIGSLAPNAGDNIFEEEQNSITVGSNLAYAAAQNYGYEPRGLPAREYLFFNQERTDKCIAIIRKAIFGDGAEDD